MQYHPYANLFPMMPDAELAYIVEDMKANGYDPSMPVITYEGQILDGRNRFKAADLAGVEPSFVEYEGDDALAYVIRHNLHRRQLSTGQKAAIVDEIAILKRGRNWNNSAIMQNKITVEQAANQIGVSARTVHEYREVKREEPELAEQVKQGKIELSLAKKKVKKNKKQAKNLKKKEEFIKPADDSIQIDIRCFNYDCIKGMNELELPKCNLLLSDPPYGMAYKSGWNEWDEIANDKIDDTADILEKAFEASCKHLIDGAHIYIFGNPNEIENIKPIFEKYFVLKNILIWDRDVIGMGDLKTYGRSYDVIYFGYYKEWRNLNGTRDRDVLRFSRMNPNEMTHPTEKPLDILEYLIKKSTNENDYVLDPFCGSCSTLIASKNTSRNAVGFELEEKYIPKWMKTNILQD